jgi:hypothetical protein
VIVGAKMNGKIAINDTTHIIINPVKSTPPNSSCVYLSKNCMEDNLLFAAAAVK